MNAEVQWKFPIFDVHLYTPLFRVLFYHANRNARALDMAGHTLKYAHAFNLLAANAIQVSRVVPKNYTWKRCRFNFNEHDWHKLLMPRTRPADRISESGSRRICSRVTFSLKHATFQNCSIFIRIQPS